jgi:hypothetical protein
MRANEWFEEFRSRFDPSKSSTVSGMYTERGRVDNEKWTKLMMDFLEGWGRDADYSVAKEKAAFGGRRFDMVWKGTHDAVAIEAENDYRGIMVSEVPKLIERTEDLRILITYVPSAVFPAEQVAEEVGTYLRIEAKRFDFEFLLVVGTEARKRATDWVGWWFYPSFISKPLVLPYLERDELKRGRAAVKSWKSQRRNSPAS